MVGIRKSGKLTVYSNRTNAPNNNTENPSKEPIVNKTEYNENTFRESERIQIQIPPERVQRMNESILQAKNQENIRKKVES
ncbi:MAG: hypothetical protein OQJ93_00555 [Ignavibacteriaceae bacterium]|nr:hypothetical protein [Ignavibacteriaceae bacterium]MCW8818391.1 hypothetical protein [Ignavibacteriaceae bacterium]MCW9094519.1 hypothetical protein [Ignavibacteriaceae bacterium]MCW9095853.1 hypothetical protein [Ignavibacteriaceae bacterium]